MAYSSPASSYTVLPLGSWHGSFRTPPPQVDLGTFYLLFPPMLGVTCSLRASLPDGIPTYSGRKNCSAAVLVESGPWDCVVLDLDEAANESRQSQSEGCGMSLGPGAHTPWVQLSWWPGLLNCCVSLCAGEEPRLLKNQLQAGEMARWAHTAFQWVRVSAPPRVTHSHHNLRSRGM